MDAFIFLFYNNLYWNCWRLIFEHTSLAARLSGLSAPGKPISLIIFKKFKCNWD